MKLINADVLLTEIRCYKEKASTFGHQDFRCGYIYALSDVEKQIASTPTIDAEQIPKWISVEERLPKVSDVALVIANGKPKPHITLHNAYLIASYWGEEGWIADGFDGWDALQVTHWMPLPEPPKED